MKVTLLQESKETFLFLPRQLSDFFQNQIDKVFAIQFLHLGFGGNRTSNQFSDNLFGEIPSPSN